MPYTIPADEQHRLVEVVYSGQVTISTHVCADGGRRGPACATLLHARAGRPARRHRGERTAGRGEFLRIAHRPRVRDSRLAYVTRPNEHSNLLIQNMASARHHAVAHFDEREKALHWLLQGP